MSTSQLQRLLRPAATRTQYLRRELAALRAGGAVDAVTRGSAGEALWFVTETGARLAEQSGQATVRPYRMTAEHAAGPLREHTLAVNDVGIAFTAAARANDDTCGPLDWIPEVNHPVSRGRHLICDALLDYVTEDQSAGTRTQRQWFIELDRATMPVSRLAAKLALYAEYAQARCTGTPQVPRWRQRYLVFPRLLVVLAGAGEETLERRMFDLAAVVAADGRLRRARVAAGVTTLDRLAEQGPLQPVCIRLGDADMAECDALLQR